MPKRFCGCLGCPACASPDRRPGSHGTLFDMDSTGTLRCPACQGVATQQRNARPSSTSRGYDAEYERNRPAVIQQARHGRPCVICRKPILASQKVTVEHVIPRRIGGGNGMDNLGPAHAWCNTGWNRGKRK